MKITVEVENGRQAADLKRALSDPQMQAFVFKVGQMMRERQEPERIAAYIEAQMFSWRLPLTKGRLARLRATAVKRKKDTNDPTGPDDHHAN